MFILHGTVTPCNKGTIGHGMNDGFIIVTGGAEVAKSHNVWWCEGLELGFQSYGGGEVGEGVVCDWWGDYWQWWY